MKQTYKGAIGVVISLIYKKMQCAFKGLKALLETSLHLIPNSEITQINFPPTM